VGNPNNFGGRWGCGEGLSKEYERRSLLRDSREEIAELSADENGLHEVSRVGDWGRFRGAEGALGEKILFCVAFRETGGEGLLDLKGIVGTFFSGGGAELSGKREQCVSAPLQKPLKFVVGGGGR